MQFELLAPVPAVTLARKLREIPLFRFVSVDELFRISVISQQVRYEANANVQKRGARAEYIQVLLEGTVEMHYGEQKTELVEPPALLGFQEVLEGTTIQNFPRLMRCLWMKRSAKETCFSKRECAASRKHWDVSSTMTTR